MQKQDGREVALLVEYRKMSEKDKCALLLFAKASNNEKTEKIPAPRLLNG